MKAITDFEQLVEMARGKGGVRVAVAAPHDEATLVALHRAMGEGWVEPILIGDPEVIASLERERGLRFPRSCLMGELASKKAAREAVRMAREGRAHLVMNGMARPADLLRAALDREIGLRTGRLFSNVSVFQVPGLNRLLIISDIGVVVSPDLGQKVAIVQNAIDVARILGVERPRVAVLAATEMVNPKVPTSLDAANLSKMAQRGQIRGGIVEGPLAIDNAISPQAAQVKGIHSEVAGRADIIIVPDVEAGNLLAKTITCFAGGRMAGVVVGGKCPIVMPSRADPPEDKLASLALGVLCLRSGSF